MDIHRKVSTAAGGGERIRAEAELLTVARHPGVVELVGLEGSTERPVLVTVLVDGPTLAAPMPLTVEEVAGVVGAVAATLADLHEQGIVHGAVLPEHVLLGPDGRPVLCGFGSGGRVGEDDELRPSTDVAALGRLLRRLATGPDARPLRRLAEAATADDPAARPSAGQLAAGLADAVPGARLPIPRSGSGHGVDPASDLRALVAGARSGRRRRPPPAAEARPRNLLLGTDWDAVVGDGSDAEAGSRAPVATATRRAVAPPPPVDRPGLRRRLPLRSAAAVGAVAAVAAAGLLLLAPWSSPAAHDEPAPATTRPTPSTRSLPPSTTAATTTTRPVPAVRTDCVAQASVLIADVDGDGCPDALRYADGVLEGGGTRWALGQAGDEVTVGDWSCRGARTVVLLRPSTGDVYRFDGWAVGAVESLTASRVATVPGGKALRAADVDRDGCHEIVVERGELPPQVVRIPRPQP